MNYGLGIKTDLFEQKINHVDCEYSVSSVHKCLWMLAIIFVKSFFESNMFQKSSLFLS